ncbi:MAG: tetratricopeptide repeat protein [Tenacibaculum sp.]|uniref:tetratricopeptide repeat-containing sensor histidine kinase n=1 Tax=Tenacibaculum sp. TaxID=1906242 RepID=UPI00181CA5EB|nr:tetratricopeptide repeat protein [Tenacibaculum sp.]NVK08744.1 tetratricopeptide repeat protein [Tenacibaculum sp.]
MKRELTLLLLISITFSYAGSFGEKDSLHLRELRDKYSYYKKEKLKEKTILYADSIVTILRALKNRGREEELELAKAYSSLGFSYISNKQPAEGYLAYKEAAYIYIKLKDSIRTANRLKALSIMESDFGLSYKSDSTALKALEYIKPDNELRSSIYNCLGINNKKRYDYNEAVNWYKKALESTEDEEKIYRYKNNIANCYRELKQYNKSLSIYKKIIISDYFKKLPNITRARLLDNYSYTKWLKGEKVSRLDFLKALKIRKEEKDYKGMCASYSHLSDYYNKSNKKNVAKGYALEMLKAARRIKNKKIIREALTKLLLFKTNKQDDYYREFLFLTEEIERKRATTQNKQIVTIHRVNEITIKAQELERKVIASELLTEQQKSQKQLWIFTVILTILFSIVYFFYKREKTKKEKAIEVYNTETRLSKKIHDELANDVYAVMNTLQNKAETDTKLLARIEKIYAQTRDISHENSPVLTGEYFEDFIKQLFLDFTNDTCKVIHKGLKEVNVNELPKEKQIVLYRVLRELLVNMKKYSKASLVLITFSQSKKTLSVAYQDNGKGVKDLSIKNGLQNMETRIKSVGGIITFESKQEKGFQAKFHFKK